MLPRSKRYCYDEGLRVALIVYVPPKWRHLAPGAPGSEIAAPVSLIDLPPTVLSIAGATQPATMSGRPLLGKRVGAPQRFAFGMRNRMDERIDFVRTVSNGRWRYIRNYMPHRPWGMNGAFEWLMKSYQDLEAHHLAGKLDAVQDRFFQAKPFEELYDLSVHPDQVDNIAARKPALVARLSKALDDQMAAINDNGFIPEGMNGEGWIASRDRKTYPLPRLMKLGRRAAEGRADNLAVLVAATADANPIIRYWGATGLFILGTQAGSARATLETLMIHDSAQHVRVVAGEAFALLGGDAGVSVLGKLAGPEQQWQVRLAALNSLTSLGDRAGSQLAVIEIAAVDETSEYVRNAGRYLAAVLKGTYKPGYPVYQVERLARSMGGNG